MCVNNWWVGWPSEAFDLRFGLGSSYYGVRDQIIQSIIYYWISYIIELTDTERGQLKSSSGRHGKTPQLPRVWFHTKSCAPTGIKARGSTPRASREVTPHWWRLPDTATTGNIPWVKIKTHRWGQSKFHLIPYAGSRWRTALLTYSRILFSLVKKKKKSKL